MSTRFPLAAVSTLFLCFGGFSSGAGAADPPPPVASCSACHGANGVGVSDDIPNLAAQKQEYLVKQLQAFRAGERSNPLMNAIATQLDDDDIAALAAYFSGLPPAAESARSASAETLAAGKLEFPQNWSSDYTLYATKNRPDNNQVREFYANDVALASIGDGVPLDDGAYLLVVIYKAKLDADGKPVEGDDGYYLKGDLAAFTAMERQRGWADSVPEHLRNDNWNYAVFSAAGEQKPGVNQASCLACHKPLDDVDYMFMHDDLKKAHAQR